MTKISIASGAQQNDERAFLIQPMIRRMAPVLTAAALLASGAAQAGTEIVPVTAPSVQTAPAVETKVAHATAKPAATGGPFEATTSAAAATEMRADMQFRSLFTAWKKLDTLDQGAVIAIPSVQPVDHLAFTSNFGVRSDPFRGTAAFHAGVDIPGPVGTPVYATADGMVDKAERSGGYGNMVEINHGKGIQTRYGHLSKILVAPYAHVHRGQLIALMGSTGRSTGPHLHYEVRIDGSAVNPVPFLQTADYLLAAKDKSVHAIPVSVGAESTD